MKRVMMLLAAVFAVSSGPVFAQSLGQLDWDKKAIALPKAVPAAYNVQTGESSSADLLCHNESSYLSALGIPYSFSAKLRRNGTATLSNGAVYKQPKWVVWPIVKRDDMILLGFATPRDEYEYATCRITNWFGRPDRRRTAAAGSEGGMQKAGFFGLPTPEVSNEYCMQAQQRRGACPSGCKMVWHAGPDGRFETGKDVCIPWS